MTNPRGLASAGVKVDEQAATSSLTLRDATDRTEQPRWTGCPMGCGQYGHEPPCTVGRPLRLSCHACGSLDWSAREALDTCRDACPMRQVA